MTTSPRTLAAVAAVHGYRHRGRVYVPLWFGRVVDSLAARVEDLYLSTPLRDGQPEDSTDYPLAAKNITLIPQPFYTSTAGALPHLLGIARSYLAVCRKAEALYIRGLCPYSTLLYGPATLLGRRVCQRIVADPLALLRSHRRSGRLVNLASIVWAWQAQTVAKLGRWLTDGAFICSGEPLARVYRSPRTFVMLTSPVSEDEFYQREDTCQGERVRILLLSYIRPEKGVEYLIEGVARLKTDRPWELWIVGPVEHFGGYHDRLHQLVAQRGLSDRVHWRGHVKYGPEMFELYRTADIFVLPSLSEGAPRVLIEARANGLPVIATNVGGIPSSVRHEADGLLVPPKDPDAIAAAIEKLIVDAELRRSLIRNGYETARRGTLERVVDLIWATLSDEAQDSGTSR